MKPLNKKTGSFIDDLAQLFTDDTVLSVSDELEEYFLIKVEKSWVDGEPITWWKHRRHQFPKLSQFAKDIFCIPGILFKLFKVSNYINYIFKAQQLQLNVFFLVLEIL